MRYAHLSPEHLRGEMAKTERSVIVEPDAATRMGQSGHNTPEVIESTDERRGSSVAEQLIRKQPQTPADSTQHDVPPGNPTQQP
jgi:hypothetical protein